MSRYQATALPRQQRHATMFRAASRGLLYLAFGSLAFMRPQLSVGGLAIVPTDAIMALAGSCWLAACSLERRRLRLRGFDRLLLLYFAAMVASALFADRPLGHFTIRLASEAYLLCVPPLIAGLLVDHGHLRRAIMAWLAGTALIAALAAGALVVASVDPASSLLPAVQHHLGSLPLGPFVRYRLAYENPNMLGAYLTASLMLVLLAAERKWAGSRSAIFLIAGVTMATIATFSAGIGGSILAMTIWYWLPRRTSCSDAARAVLVAGTIVAAAFVFAQAFTPVAYPHPLFRIDIPGTELALYPASRMQTWVDAARTFARHPVTGIGVGADVAHVRFVEPGGAHVLLRDAHNVALSVAAGSGVLSVIALAAIVIAVSHRTLKAAGSGAPDLVTFATGAAVLNVLVYQGIGGSFEDARFVWVMIGLWLASVRIAGTDRGRPQSARPSLEATG